MNENTIRTEESIIKLKRRVQYCAYFRNFKVFIDGKMVAKIGVGDELEFYVEPGEYEIFIKLDWCRSKKIKINPHSNETINLVSGTINSIILFLLLLGISFTFAFFKNKVSLFGFIIFLFILSFIQNTSINLKEEN